MELTRSKIKEYMNLFYEKSEFFKRVKTSNEVIVLKNSKFSDLDFIYALEELFFKITSNYKNLTLSNFKPSLRQITVLITLSGINNDILYNPYNDENKNWLNLQLYKDFYWNIWDYFDDYNNKTEQISQDEFNLILPILESFLNGYKKMKDSN